MNIVNCKRCRKLFHDITGLAVCPECSRKLEEQFSEVKNYILWHRRASAREISSACHVEVKQIQEWIREGRILPTDSPIRIPCENCGDMIRSGKLCEKCRKERQDILRDLSKALKESEEKSKASAKKQKKTGAKMRYGKKKG